MVGLLVGWLVGCLFVGCLLLGLVILLIGSLLVRLVVGLVCWFFVGLVGRLVGLLAG